MNTNDSKKTNPLYDCFEAIDAHEGTLNRVSLEQARADLAHLNMDTKAIERMVRATLERSLAPLPSEAARSSVFASLSLTVAELFELLEWRPEPVTMGTRRKARRMAQKIFPVGVRNERDPLLSLSVRLLQLPRGAAHLTFALVNPKPGFESQLRQVGIEWIRHSISGAAVKETLTFDEYALCQKQLRDLGRDETWEFHFRRDE